LTILTDLDERFALIEKRVRALQAENSGLHARVEELEQKLASASSATRELDLLNGKKQQMREKIEKLLQTLEFIGRKA